MKNIKGILAGVLALAALTVSCVAEKDTTPEIDITTVRCSIPRIDVEEDFATGILDTLTTTKATFSGGNFLWSAGDKIGIVPNTGAQIYFEVSDGAGTSTASFNGGDWAMKSTGTFYAYYPLYPDIFLSKDHVSVSYTGQTQSGNNNNLHTGDYWTLYTEGTTAVGNALNFSFNHLTSFFKTYVTVPAGTYTKITFSAPSEVFIKDGYFDLSAQTPAIVGTTMTDVLSLDLQNVTFADESELTGYLVLAPVDITGIPITVTVYKDGEPAYEYTMTKANPMVAAKTYAFRATALTQLAASATQANALFAAGATSVSITEPLTEDIAIVLPNTSEAVTLILPTTASTSTLTVSYPPAAESYPATLSITGPEGADLNIQTPNSTVTVNGIAYDQVTCRTAANTCIIPVGVTVNNLKVVQGGVQVYGTVSQIDLSEQEDDAIINVSGTVTSLLGEDDEEYVPATGITLNQSSINLNVGATETLTATVAPVGAYPNVIWSSSDDSIATVSANGVVTAVAEGSATITAMTISGGFTSSCEVTVNMDYNKVPFTITSAGSISASIRQIGSPAAIALDYQIGHSDWAPYAVGTSINLTDGEFVRFRAADEGNSSLGASLNDYYKVGVTGSGTADFSGNIMSLLDRELQKTEMPEWGFVRLFKDCLKLVSASNLRLTATTLSNSCYREMFGGCTKLSAAPSLPATTLAADCYREMFRGCTKLSAAPSLPATTLAAACYDSMFYECYELTTAPALPATTLAPSCYASMFYRCYGLKTAPSLPATILTDWCYAGMFNTCTGLTTAPSLPATTLTEGCYSMMFYHCIGLNTAPSLPATTLANNCYQHMFRECSSLSVAPSLPATALADGCYQYMFEQCKALSVAPSLPATTLANNCYRGMFYTCIELADAPVLPATTLAQECYYQMFTNCKSLNYIKMLATDVSANGCLYNWVGNIAPTGTFVKNASATWDVTGNSGVPSGWTVLTYVPGTPEAIDLGLPSGIKWANMNLGASVPEEYGDYYAWGETEPYYISQSPLTWKDGKTGYNWASYKWCNGSGESLTKYVTVLNGQYGTYDGKSVLDSEDDAARVKFGGNWRMPTEAECAELVNNCTWTWITNYNGSGVDGRLVTAPNGHSIFLPAAGCRLGSSLYEENLTGYYWSSSLPFNFPSDGQFIDFTSSKVTTLSVDRHYGFQVRPVCFEQ